MMKAEMAASWAFRSRGFVGAALAASFGLAVAASTPLIEWPSWGPVGTQTAGWLVFLCGAAVRFWATLYVGGRKGVSLVHEGPYSICRNPLYLGTCLIAMSAAIMLGSLTLAAGVSLVAMFYAMATVPAEERFLRQRLGDVYLRYCETVPRFVPRFSGFRTPQRITVSVKSLRLECQRAARWVWVPLGVQLALHLRSADWWPRWLSLP
ncbi:MAG: isoprenylcysteine carboxylmethyltransferase family protein [Pirellulales bacterium]